MEKESAPTIFQKLLGQDDNLDRDDVLDCIFWYRVMTGISLGVVSGVLGLQGWPIIALFGAIIIIGAALY